MIGLSVAVAVAVAVVAAEDYEDFDDVTDDAQFRVDGLEHRDGWSKKFYGGAAEGRHPAQFWGAADGRALFYRDSFS